MLKHGSQVQVGPLEKAICPAGVGRLFYLESLPGLEPEGPRRECEGEAPGRRRKPTEAARKERTRSARLQGKA